MPCSSCGAEGPTHIFEFNEEIGLVVVRLINTKERELCRRCVGRYFRASFFTNLFAGWWGLISMVKTPINLIQNIAEYWRCRDLEMPDANAMANAYAVGPSSPPAEGKSLWLIIATAVCIVLSVFLTMYKYRAELFKGPSPYSAAYAEPGAPENENLSIDGGQLAEDVRAIEADFTSKNWTGMRIELLSRESYRLRVTSVNEQLQRHLLNDRSTNLRKDDACERQILDEFAPALNAYTKAIGNLFSFANVTPTLKGNDQQKLQALFVAEERDAKLLSGAMINAGKIECNKE